MPNKFVISGILFFILPVIFLHGQISEKNIQDAISQYEDAAFNSGGIDPTLPDIFKNAYSLYPKRKELMAYWGSSLCILAGDQKAFNLKVQFVYEGMDLLDKAIKDDPENIVSRFIRTSTYYLFPDILGKRPLGEKDADFLIKKQKENPKAFNTLLDIRRVLYYKAYYVYVKNNKKEAQELLQKAFSLQPAENKKDDRTEIKLQELKTMIDQGKKAKTF